MGWVRQPFWGSNWVFCLQYIFFFSSRRRHTWSSTVSWARRCVFETEREVISRLAKPLTMGWVETSLPCMRHNLVSICINQSGGLSVGKLAARARIFLGRRSNRAYGGERFLAHDASFVLDLDQWSGHFNRSRANVSNIWMTLCGAGFFNKS